jgi:hypothetical protein
MITKFCDPLQHLACFGKSSPRGTNICYAIDTSTSAGASGQPSDEIPNNGVSYSLFYRCIRGSSIKFRIRGKGWGERHEEVFVA